MSSLPTLDIEGRREDMTDVLIAGAGIGGLTAALTLHARGISATVIERAHELRALGVGINLLPHAVRELYELGLGDDLAQNAVAPAAISYFDTDGKLLFREPRGIDGGYGYPQYSVHRGKLQMLLLSAVRDRLGSDAVRTGAELTGFTPSNDHVQVHTAAGDFVAAALVGADGIHSAVRARLHPGDDPLLWSGVRMFRGAADGKPFLDGRTMAIIKDGDGSHKGPDLVTYPIGHGLINWVVMLPESEPGRLPGGAKWNQAGDPSEVLRHLERWRLGWLDAADLVRRTDPVLEYPMVDRDVLPWWGRGPVTLLGDAAHPMYPVGANGGSQAVVDARVLAEELARDFPGGLRRYEDTRRKETAEVVAANREMHSTGATQRPGELARVTAKYADDTHARRTS
jgi:5-methylphenazine-1-carboxylate 1-monooxygenase